MPQSHQDRHWMRIALLWRDTLIEEALVDSRKPATIGTARGNTLVVPDLAEVGEKHLLFAPDPGGFTLLPTHAMTGSLTLAGGDAFSLDDARRLRGNAIQVGGRDWGLIDLGPDLAVFFQCVSPPDRVPRRPLWGTMESSMLTAILSAVVLHLGLLVVAFLFWDAAPAFATLAPDDRLTGFFVEPPPPEPPEDVITDEPIENIAKRAKDDEGVFGERDKVVETKVPERDADLVDRVREVGVHDALGSDLLGRGPMQNVFGNKTGFADKLGMAMAGGDGDLVVGRGTEGMGLRGTGNGNGGQGFGSVRGMGRLDTGRGRGTRARLGKREQTSKKVEVRRGPSDVAGFCKEADILRVVKARQRGIKYCYERELARDPELQGSLTMSWSIMLDGSVGSVLVEKRLGHKKLESCVTRSIKRWRFAKPESGMCRVRFPFVFDGGL